MVQTIDSRPIIRRVTFFLSVLLFPFDFFCFRLIGNIQSHFNEYYLESWFAEIQKISHNESIEWFSSHDQSEGQDNTKRIFDSWSVPPGCEHLKTDQMARNSFDGKK
jgi:hypothetical protein